MQELIKAKEKFIQNGYCELPINLINLDFYNFLKNNFICNDEEDLKNLFYTFRFDSEKIETKFISETKDYLEAENEKQKLYLTHANTEISQIWFWNNNWYEISKIKNIPNKELLNSIESGLNSIVSYLYDLNESDKLIHPELQLTYYNKNCRFTPHTDGPQSGIMCSILIYLNEDYKQDNGGLLILGNEEIVPSFGKCAIMDLTKHDIRHGVTEVVGDVGRFAILSFPKIHSVI